MKLKYGRNASIITPGARRRSAVMRTALATLGAAPAIGPGWHKAVLRNGGFGMGLNDTYGDCVAADCGNQERLRTANVGKMWSPTDDEVAALYAAFQGYTGSLTDSAAVTAYLKNNDGGANEQDAIAYLINNGFVGHKLTAAANLDPAVENEWKWSVWVFGTARLGINIYAEAQDLFEANKPWDFNPKYRPEGGHDVPIVDYDMDGTIWVVTWGRPQAVTPAFMAAHYPDGTPYVEEYHAEFAVDWTNTVGTAPNRLNVAQLASDLQAVSGHGALIPPPPTTTPPPPRISKLERANLITMAVNAGLYNPGMDEPSFTMALQRVLNQR